MSSIVSGVGNGEGGGDWPPIIFVEGGSHYFLMCSLKKLLASYSS